MIAARCWKGENLTKLIYLNVTAIYTTNSVALPVKSLARTKIVTNTYLYKDSPCVEIAKDTRPSVSTMIAR